ncbi:Phage tail protein [Candidatus Hepatincolaceae symbiont of Richtersius coronifer]
MNNVKLTTVGLQKLSGSTVDIPLHLEKFAVSDMEINFDDLPTQFLGEKYKTFINSQYNAENTATLECVISGIAAINEGFYIRSLGIFDKDNDLIIVAKVPEVYRPAFIEGQVLSENIFNIAIALENTENITVKINEQILATQDALNREISNRAASDISLNTLIVQKEEESKSRDNTFITKAEHLENLRTFYRLFLGTIQAQGNDYVWPKKHVEILWCNGQILRVVDYPELYQVLGNRWGGTKDVNFNLPNIQDRVLRGRGSFMNSNYQEDAMQRITGEWWQDRGIGTGSNGAFYTNKTNGYSPVWDGYSWDHNYANVLGFDSARVVRTASENRVKSAGATYWMIVKILI